MKLLFPAFLAACASQPLAQPVTTTSAVLTTPASLPTAEEGVVAEPGYVELTMPTRINRTSSGMNDSAIATILETANQASMDEASLALRYATDQRVKDLAQLLYDHARDAKIEEDMVAASIGVQPEPSATSRQIATQAGHELDTLQGLSFRIDFDRAFIGQQIRTQKALLDLIDNTLMPSAHSVALRQAVMNMRPLAQDHLDRAIALDLVFWHR